MIPDHSTGTGAQGRGRHQKVWSAGYTTPLLSRHGADAIANPARSHHIFRRGGRVVERTALEMRHTCKGIGGSNPPLSAIILSQTPKPVPPRSKFLLCSKGFAGRNRTLETDRAVASSL